MTVLSTQMDGSSADSTCIDEDIFIKTMGPERPGRFRTFGLGPSIKDVFGGGYQRSQEQNNVLQAQLQEQFQAYRVQLETQMKEMMEAQMEVMRTQMEATIQAQAATIQAQQIRMEHLESQVGTRGGPVAHEAAPLRPFQSQQIQDASSTHQSTTWVHQPVSQPQQNLHEFPSSSSRQRFTHQIRRIKARARARARATSIIVYERVY